MRGLWLLLVCTLILVSCSPPSVSENTNVQPFETSPSSATPTAQPTQITKQTVVPTPSLSDPVPFRKRKLTRYPLTFAGAQAFAWSAHSHDILYGGEQLYLFNTIDHQSRVLTDDLYRLDSYVHLFPAWDNDWDVIVYVRKVSDTHADIVAIHPDGQHMHTFVSNVFIKDGWEIVRQDARKRASIEPVSIFDVSIASNGRVGLLSEQEIVSMRFGEADERIPLPASAAQRLNSLMPSDYHQLWLAPDGLHYALAITETLSIYHRATLRPLQTFTFEEGYTPDPTLVYRFKWSPDSRSFFFIPAYVEDVGNYWRAGSYAQQIDEVDPQRLGRGSGLPRAVGGSGRIRDAAWSSDGQWLAGGQQHLPQCAGRPPGCVQSQVIINPFATQASVIWSTVERISGTGVWSADDTQIALVCFNEDLSSPSEMCIITLERANQIPRP